MSGRFDIFEVLEDVWCVRYSRERSASYIVKTSPGAVVVDAGPDPTANGLMMGLQHARVGLSSIRALVLTHWDEARAAGAPRLRERAGAHVCATAECAAHVKTTVDRILTGGEHIEDRLEVLPADSINEELRLFLPRHGALFASNDDEQLVRAEWLLPATSEPTRLPHRNHSAHR